MRIGKGDIRSQRARRRDRYRGCPVCGLRGAQCTECDLGKRLVSLHGTGKLTLVADGSFVDSSQDSGGHGGAGLVLIQGDEILASRACGFQAVNSSDAEFQAVIRAARWAPGVPIYTDARELPGKMMGVNPCLVVHYLAPGRRGEGYVLARRLSIEGRCRLAPGTIPSLGVEFAAERARHGKAGRRQMAAELLLERARRDPDFRGDFSVIAAQLGWTSGARWQHNPAIRIASQLWLEQNGERETFAQQEESQDP